MNQIDLTPFGFTPTETLVYGALLEHGPSSGYALAKKLSLARANAYQSLNGLVKKAAATASDDRPQKYRPVRPDALLAHLTGLQAEKLDLLERQIRQAPAAEGDTVVPIEGMRALVNMALRTAARETGPIQCVGPADVLQAIAPAWRRRQVDGLETRLWVVGPELPLPIEAAGIVPTEKVDGFFTGRPFLMTGADAGIVANIRGGDGVGHWATDPIFTALIRTAVVALTT